MTAVKVCGLANAPDALAAVQAGARYLGFVLVPGTPRHLALEQLADISAEVRRAAPDVQLVGVFRQAPLDDILAAQAYLDIVQLHGDETPDQAQALRQCGLRLWKAMALIDEAAAQRALQWCPCVEALLVDAEKGGRKRPCRHDLAQKLAPRTTLILAGGLTPENVAGAIELVRPAVVDVASGVEDAPRQKNHQSIRDFFAEVRRADQTLA